MTAAAVILAAGASRRLGRPKQLIEIGGVPLVRRAAAAAAAAGCRPVIVVTGAHAEQVEAVLDRRSVDVARHDGWEAGQGGSVAAGVRDLVRRAPSVDRVLILPCDQPMIGADHLRALVRAAGDPSCAIAATGHPDGAAGAARFTRPCFRRLQALEGERGAQVLIEAGEFAVATVAAPPEAGDVDTPDDLERLGLA